MSSPSDEERERLRRTFDTAAARYHRARPDYPEGLFDDLVRLAGLRAGDRLLEIGCGTGKATLPLARRGFRIEGVELGSALAVEADRNLAAYPLVSVRTGSFDEWRPPGPGFDLVYAATSWHWLHPATRYQRAWDALRPGGHLAIWGANHMQPDDGDPIFGQLQRVYDRIGEVDESPIPRPGKLPDLTAEVEGGGLFEIVGVRHHDWELRYDAESYIELLRTFSGHIAMGEEKREHVFGEVRALLGSRPDRTLRRHWGAVLHVVRRRP